jgi:hypothetical protein
VSNPSDFAGFSEFIRYCHFSFCCNMPIRMHLYLPQPFTRTIQSGRRSGLHRGETFPLLRARFHWLLCPLLTSSMRSEQVALLSAIFCRTRHPGAHGRPPGVNTCLSVRECRVYGHTLQWIEDFILLCRLVPVCTPDT